MSQHTATVVWQHRPQDDFLAGRYSREHVWTFDGGATSAASPSPHVVRTPYSNPDLVDPEEAFVASAASCHMLTFLYLAGKQGFLVESYRDSAVGELTAGTSGVSWISSIVLRPRIEFGGVRRPTDDELARLHREAHEQCYIANSVKTQITVAGAD